VSGGIEKLAVEIEEIANGVYPSEKPAQELLISKAKKIRQLARSRKTPREKALVCQKCDRAYDIRFCFRDVPFISLSELWAKSRRTVAHVL